MTMINHKSTFQPQFNQKSKFEVEISTFEIGYNLVDSRLILGRLVDFLLIAVTFSTHFLTTHFSTKYQH